MNSFKTNGWVERWCLGVCAVASRRIGIIVIGTNVVLSILTALFYILTRMTFSACMSVACFFIAFIFFERRQFNSIIQRQKNRINEIESNLKDNDN